jgi:Protein of unknown function (DUF2946)
MSLFGVKSRRHVARLAIFAVLLSVLMPALSNAGVGRRLSNGLTEICTAYGVRYVILDRDDAPPLQSSGGHDSHCPYCSSTNFHFLPAANDVKAFLPQSHGKTVFAAVKAEYRVAVLLSAFPRGPPLFIL